MFLHAWLIFVFLVEMGFLHVDQAGLELLTLDDPPTSVSQNAGIIGVSRGDSPDFSSFTFVEDCFMSNDVVAIRACAVCQRERCIFC